MAISVFLVEDHYTTRQGMRLVLEEDAEINVVGEMETVEDALDPILALRPDVIVSDYSFGKQKTGAELIRALQDLRCFIPVLILSGYDTLAFAQAAFMAGARGYMLKNEYGPDLVKAVKAVAQGGMYVSPLLEPLLTEGMKRISQLTDREWQVVRFVARGLKNQEMAQIFGIEERTVRAHLEQVFKKLGLSHRGELIAWAWKNGYAER